jgi:hypothetical protein
MCATGQHAAGPCDDFSCVGARTKRVRVYLHSHIPFGGQVADDFWSVARQNHFTVLSIVAVKSLTFWGCNLVSDYAVRAS